MKKKNTKKGGLTGKDSKEGEEKRKHRKKEQRRVTS